MLINVNKVHIASAIAILCIPFTFSQGVAQAAFKTTGMSLHKLPATTAESEKPAKPGRLTKPALINILKKAGFKGAALRTAYAVAMKESHANPISHNYNPRTGDDSYGMFQINLYGSLKARTETYNLSSAKDLTDPVKNAEVAYSLSKGGTNWSPWKAEPGQRDYRVTATYKAVFDSKEDPNASHASLTQSGDKRVDPSSRGVGRS